MRLTRLYLAGFKSFASPTEIRLPANTLAIVGPNGCGKSNLIDALRWVMGESSARHLRGQALDDLIFAGSGDRAAASRAVVELTLDNREHRIHGPFAAYEEITVRRSLDRDGQSRYEINNTRVRRRDVVDLFLGTGVGARSYSVIEQGQVNRIVDAKPDELRGYLEEAAGISVYRERRRETANRITHTEENLSRLNDIAAELERQEATLARQARAARRYRELAEERRYRQVEAAAVALIYAREERLQLDRIVAEAGEIETGCETRLSQAEAAQDEAEHAHQAAGERLGELSAEKYRLANDLNAVTTRLAELDARLEGLDRQARHDWDTRERRETERREAQTRREQLIVEQRDSRVALDDLAAEHDRARDRRAAAEAELDALRREAMTAAEARIEPQREQARLTERLESVARDCRRLESAPAAAELAQVREELAGLQEESRGRAGEIEATEAAAAKAEDELAAAGEAAEASESIVQEREEARRAARNEHDGLLAEHQALERLIRSHAATDKDEAAGPRLVDRLVEADIHDPWVGHALGEALEAELIEDLDAMVAAEIDRFADEEGAGGWWLEAGRSSADADWLAERVHDFPGRPVEDLEAALARRGSLARGEFLITPSGWWVGRHWLGRADASGAAAHLAHLARRRELGAAITHAETALQAAETALNESRVRRDEDRRALDVARRERDERARTLESARLAHRHLGERVERLESTVEALETRAAAETDELEAARREQAHLEEQRESAAAAVTEADRRRDAAVERQESAREALDAAREAARAAADRFHRARREIEQRDETIARLADEIRRLGHECEAIARRLNEQAQEAERARNEREGLLGERERYRERLVEAEAAETRAREAQQAAAEAQGEARSAVAEARAERDAARAKSEQARIDRAQGETREQHARARLEEAREQLAGDEDEPEAEAIEQLARETGVGERLAGRLAELDAQIRRLGSVNLSAIEDHREVEQRREELAGQIEDVESALAQLAEAIDTMDRQTRERFRETFHAVNQRLGPRFEALFGGGEARLELTGDDPLDAGVALMARPPGKRISHLSLLSGGERALTATALIFAIFELNPAPFCILDEVDAPLDEANVGRFCAMVSAMSDRVQFMYITHNKTTMASASALVGVTMREAGVSRIVSVDVDAAVDLIET
ncbi:AAA family ATPase [Guyparkeria hydrothermalis]|uniref:AAA family ATPase n=1 Tax=Guyparkeria hydrothermalis TaxID=923 RepID=UPI0020217DE3|nr:AAA family ATPase [Guyparkeria hydrothermalis]MCL7745056.1 AAA family ATPase [Guyparkeria hydrothermalis]